MLEIVFQYTNSEIEKYRNTQITVLNVSFENIRMSELKSFIGLMYYIGLHKNNHVCVDDIWSNEFGFNLYKATLSKRRFQFMSARLRFDDKNTRAEMREIDVLAPNLYMWDTFVSNCKKMIRPHKV